MFKINYSSIHIIVVGGVTSSWFSDKEKASQFMKSTIENLIKKAFIKEVEKGLYIVNINAEVIFNKGKIEITVNMEKTLTLWNILKSLFWLPTFGFSPFLKTNKANIEKPTYHLLELIHEKVNNKINDFKEREFY